MNFCPKCGKPVNPNSNFCPNCGTNLREYLVTPPSNSTSSSETAAPISDATEPVSQGDTSESSDVQALEEEMEPAEQWAMTPTINPAKITVKLPEKKADGDKMLNPATPMTGRPKATKNPAFNPKRLNRILRTQLEALYKELVKKFNVQGSNGDLKTKFLRIRLKLLHKIEGYDVDELFNRVVPLCEPDYEATQDDLTFVSNLIIKYQNYGRKSQLDQQLNMLSGQSSNAIVDADHLNSLQDYMHVDRGQLEQTFVTALKQLTPERGKLIFLVGNVGDGKSHLIGYLRKNYSQLFETNHVQIHYDATESFDPKKTAMETLTEVLMPFSDTQIDTTTTHLIVAINMGILMNFIRHAKDVGGFDQLLRYLKGTGIATRTTNKDRLMTDQFTLLSFRDYPLFKIDETGVNSVFYDQLFAKVARPDELNPFYAAYMDDKQHYVMRLTHHNFELFMNPQVRETLKFLLIKIQIESKAIISIRALLELIHDILVPTRLAENEVITYRESLPYLLFGGSGDSKIIKKINEFDPQKFQNTQVEELMTKVYNSNQNIQELVEETLGKENAGSITWLWDFINVDKVAFSDKMGLLLRVGYLLDRQGPTFNDDLYYRFLKLLQAAQTKDARNPANRELYKMVKQFIYDWNGSPQNNYIFTFINERKKFGVAVPFNLVFKSITEHDFNIVFSLKNDKGDTPYDLVIGYDLFTLIDAVTKGYLLKAEDKHRFVGVETFIENIIKSQETTSETLIGNLETNQFYRLTYDGMDVEMGEV